MRRAIKVAPIHHIAYDFAKQCFAKKRKEAPISAGEKQERLTAEALHKRGGQAYCKLTRAEYLPLLNV